MVNPVTGTASVTIPVPLSDGRGGMTPRVELSYDSGNGNGPFGLGWSLSLPSITRRTDKRLPRYDDEDVFVLSGAEDLVPVGGGRYRPRIDTHRQRVLRVADHWQVTTATNETTLFGPDDSSRIADGDRVFTWLPRLWRDDRGNVVEYVWTEDGASRLLSAIRYANVTPGQQDDFLLELELDYEDRPDPHSSHRSGFEVRLTQRCAGLRMVHRFPELGAVTTVRMMTLSYHAADERRASRLASITVSGVSDGVPVATLPTLEFGYVGAALGDEFGTLDAGSALNLPAGLSTGYALVDLDGEALPGVLAEQGGAWFYKRNLGGGRFAPSTAVSPAPSSTGGHLLDLDGDGRRTLVSMRSELPTYVDRADDGGWERPRAFTLFPRVDWSDRRMRLADLTGDGRVDALFLGGEGVTWYESRGRDGFDPGRGGEPGTVEVLFHDETEMVQLTDMSGDGLPDLVRVRHGEVSYLPGLGYGRFGERVVMANAPHVNDPRRVRLADVDGTGPADLIYLGEDEVTIWLNECGNRFADPVTLPRLPHLTDVDDVRVVDLFGTGTSCLVWSTTVPGDELHYLDLMQEGRPHLLRSISNGLGATTTLSYQPSTAYYRDDEQAGRPWHTPLPFVVHCVSEVDVHDAVSSLTAQTRYMYHHGYFDRAEREFRGFASVDWSESDSSGSPGRFTRQWFHTGVEPGRGDLWEALAPSWFPSPHGLPPPALPVGLSEPTARQAVRALKGRLLRTEVYALDDRELPYQVTVIQPEVRLLADAATPVFDVYDRQRLEQHHERDRLDPRVEHWLLLDIDEYGAERASARVWYPRSRGMPDEITEQAIGAVVVTRRDLSHVDTQEAFRPGLLVQATAVEATSLRPSPDRLVGVDDIAATQQSHLIDRVRVRYWSDDLTSALPFGEVNARGLVFQTYALALTPDHLVLLDAPVDPTAGGYVRLDDSGPDTWWVPSARPEYDSARFYRLMSQRDPFGAVTRVVDDRHSLMVIERTDPIGNTVRVTPDYRALAPAQIIDANGAVTAAAYDALGRPAGTAALSLGDSLVGFRSDPAELYLEDPLGRAADLLAGATSRVLYHHDQAPAATVVLERERHADPASPIRHTITFTDGLGREFVRKARAEPGEAPWPGADGVLRDDASRPTPTRWTGTVRTVRNAAGAAVRRYEPYFAPSHRCETEAELARVGVAATLHYDALARLIRTLNPDGSQVSVEFHAWHQVHFDENDNGDPATNPHAGTPTVRRLDPLGREVRIDADNGDRTFTTTVVFDVEGNEVGVIDARGVAVLHTRYDAAGAVLRTESPDAGTHRTLQDVAGKPLFVWTPRGEFITHEYDAAQRLRSRLVDGTEVEHNVYGDDATAPSGGHLRGRLYQTIDGAGLTTNHEYDPKGNLLRTTRDGMTVTLTYDALNRVVAQTQPDGTVVTNTFNEGGLLGAVTLSDPTGRDVAVVRNVDYEASGQRMLVEFGNGAATTYGYDPRTTRLARLLTTAGGQTMQDLTFAYDPAGNVTGVTDAAAPFHNDVVPASTAFEYDALYRLTVATGREHIGQSQRPEYDADDRVRSLPHVNDGQALRRYTERYGYDEVGNLVSTRHLAGSGVQWHRRSRYAPDSNRLLSTSLPGDGVDLPPRYTYDDAGNTTSMPHLDELSWDHDGRLVEVVLSATPGARRVVRYRYDRHGQRASAIVTQNGVVVEERLYNGEYETSRTFRPNGDPVSELHTLHIRDGAHRFALVETRPSGARVIRYQHGNHLGSACVELDGAGALLTYEEYYPFGATSYQAAPTVAGVSLKRYRYTGKERDEETGFAYYGARYYLPWLGRWTSPDPSGVDDGTNRFAYVGNNPVRFIDPDGRQRQEQLWLYQARVFWQAVTATAATRGISPQVRADLQNIARLFGATGRIDAAHVGRPFATLRAGVTSFVMAQDYSLNRQQGATIDRLRVLLRRALGLFTRRRGRDRGATLGTRYGQPPRNPVLAGAPQFQAAAPPTPPVGAAGASPTAAAARPPQVQLELFPTAEPPPTAGPKSGVSAAGEAGSARLGALVGLAVLSLYFSYKIASASDKEAAAKQLGFDILLGAALQYTFGAAGGPVVGFVGGGVYDLFKEGKRQLDDPVYRELAQFLGNACRPNLCHIGAPNHLQQPNFTEFFLTPEPR